MRTKNQLILISMVVIITIHLYMDYTYSALSPMKRRELVTAYKNGYYQALQLDIKEIERLQNDKGILTHKIKMVGVKYADLIEIMNSPNPDNSKENREFRRRSTVEVNRKY